MTNPTYITQIAIEPFKQAIQAASEKIHPESAASALIDRVTAVRMQARKTRVAGHGKAAIHIRSGASYNPFAVLRSNSQHSSVEILQFRPNGSGDPANTFSRPLEIAD